MSRIEINKKLKGSNVKPKIGDAVLNELKKCIHVGCKELVELQKSLDQRTALDCLFLNWLRNPPASKASALEAISSDPVFMQFLGQMMFIGNAGTQYNSNRFFDAFVRKYFSTGLFDFDGQWFEIIVSRFEQTLVERFEPVEYYCELYNVELEVDKIEISEGISIENIDSRPYLKLVLKEVISIDKPIKTSEADALQLIGSVVGWLNVLSESAILSSAMVKHRLVTVSMTVSGSGKYRPEPEISGLVDPLKLSKKEVPILKKYIDFIQWNKEGKRSSLINRFNIAVSRFRTANERYYANDQLLDYVIALEAMFSFEAGSEITHKLCHRASNILCGFLKKKPEDIYSNLKKCYTDRSKLVHGASSSIELSYLPELRNVVKSGLLFFLSNPEYFKEDYLGKQAFFESLN